MNGGTEYDIRKGPIMNVVRVKVCYDTTMEYS